MILGAFNVPNLKPKIIFLQLLSFSHNNINHIISSSLLGFLFSILNTTMLSSIVWFTYLNIARHFLVFIILKKFMNAQHQVFMPVFFVLKIVFLSFFFFFRNKIQSKFQNHKLYFVSFYDKYVSFLFYLTCENPAFIICWKI